MKKSPLQCLQKNHEIFENTLYLVGWGGECVTPVKNTCPQPVTGLVSRLVFTGSIPVLHTNLWFQKHLKPASG